MAESVLVKLGRKFRQQVLPTYARNTILRLLPSDTIGDEGHTKWALKILKEVAEPTMKEAGGDWQPNEDKFDLTSIEFALYDLQHRITMNRSERAKFERAGVLPVGIEEVGYKFANKTNYAFCRGKDSTKDQFPRTPTNFLIDNNATSTDPADPTLGTAASVGAWDAAGNAQKDFAQLASELEKRGFDVGNSVVLFPEVCSIGMRRPIITGSSVYADSVIRELAVKQGFLGAISVKDEMLYTAAAATPTVEAWDLYALDLGSVIVGYTVPEKSEAVYDPIDKRTVIDTNVIFCPIFKPKKYDTDGYYYKGVSRVTGVDLNT